MKLNSYNKTPLRAKEILEVIHSDIVGSVNTSYTGKRFFLTIIDEASRKPCIYYEKQIRSH